VVRFNATTLSHIDAVEWAPSTASIASIERRPWHVGFTLDSGRIVAAQRTDVMGRFCCRSRLKPLPNS